MSQYRSTSPAVVLCVECCPGVSAALLVWLDLLLMELVDGMVLACLVICNSSNTENLHEYHDIAA